MFPVVPRCGAWPPGQNRDNSGGHGENRDNSVPTLPDRHRKRFWFGLPLVRGRRGRRTKAEILADHKAVQENLERDIDALFAEMYGSLSRDWAASIGCAYARYSTDFQHSICDQLRGVFDRAIALGIYIPREYAFYDIGVSGRKSNRPGLSLVQGVMGKKAATVLLVFTTNRLYRVSHTCMKFVMEDLVERNLRCIFVQTGIDTNDTEQWELLLGMRAMLDKQMTTQYAPNIRAAHIGLFLRRMVVSTLPYGFMGEDVPGP